MLAVLTYCTQLEELYCEGLTKLQDFGLMNGKVVGLTKLSLGWCDSLTGEGNSQDIFPFSQSRFIQETKSDIFSFLII